MLSYKKKLSFNKVCNSIKTNKMFLLPLIFLPFDPTICLFLYEIYSGICLNKLKTVFNKYPNSQTKGEINTGIKTKIGLS